LFNKQEKVMHDFVNIADRLPEAEQEVEVLRDYGGVVANPQHHACGCRFGVERTKYTMGQMRGFVCDMISTGSVSHWRPACSMPVATVADYSGLDELSPD